jgi:hypothetical protein
MSGLWLMLASVLPSPWLAQAADVQYQYIPFKTPLPVWDYWYLLLVPLCLGVSVVYKTVRCATLKRVPREAAEITLVILLSMAAAAAALSGLVKLREIL